MSCREMELIRSYFHGVVIPDEFIKPVHYFNIIRIGVKNSEYCIGLILFYTAMHS